MTATTTAMPHELVGRTWSSLLRIAAVIAVLVVLALGSFAFGQSTADTSDGNPAVVATHSAPAVPTASCGHTAHTPPC